MPRAGWSNRLAAAIRNASGSHPHIRASSAAAVASAATRSGPTMRASSSPASAGESTPRREGPGAVAGDQPEEPVAAGDQHQAAGAGGQQGADLVGVAGVVQHHQQPLVGQQRPVHGGGLRLVGGDLLGGHAQGVRELGQRLDRRKGGVGA